jgi:DNA-binding CsgD family transcriptional regulator
VSDVGSTEDLVRRVEDACRDLLSAKALRERVLDLLRPVVPYDAHVFALTDPVTLIATAPHADVPMLPWERLPEIIRWRYLTPLNRVDTLAGRPAASLRTATDDPADSLVWQHVQRDLGVVDTAVVTFSDRYGVWAFLELWRLTDPFTAAELAALTALVPGLTTGLRSTVARTFLDPDGLLLPTGPAVVVLGPDLAVRTQTDGAAAALLRLLPPDEPMPPVPAAAYNVGAALIAEEHGVGLGEPWSRIHLGGSRWVTAKASRLGEDIAVSIEPATTAERLDLFARAAGLSDRETEVITLLGVGLDTREIAGQLFLSEHTVNDHVKAVLAKTGVRTRQALLARIAGTGG